MEARFADWAKEVARLDILGRVGRGRRLEGITESTSSSCTILGIMPESGLEDGVTLPLVVDMVAVDSSRGIEGRVLDSLVVSFLSGFIRCLCCNDTKEEKRTESMECKGLK
jgi:hypothetical protein